VREPVAACYPKGLVILFVSDDLPTNDMNRLRFIGPLVTLAAIAVVVRILVYNPKPQAEPEPKPPAVAQAAPDPHEILPPFTLTPADKVARLPTRPKSIVGYANSWAISRSVGEANIIDVADGIVTLKDEVNNKYFDAPIDRLPKAAQHALERVQRLCQGKEHPDERNLLGSWGLAYPYGGIDASSTSGLTTNGFPIRTIRLQRKFVFTGFEFDNGSTHQSFKQINKHDPFRSPKTLNGLFYELTGDELRIYSGSVRKNHKLDLETISPDDPKLQIYRRLPDVMTLPIMHSSETDPELIATLHELRTLLETASHDEFYERYHSPLRRQMLAQTRAKWNLKEVEPIREWRHFYARRMDVLMRVIPLLSQKDAYFGFGYTKVHLDDQHPVEHMVRHEGRWYVDF